MTGPDGGINVIISSNPRLWAFMCLSYTEHPAMLSSEDCHRDSDQPQDGPVVTSGPALHIQPVAPAIRT